jgi:hypothetical protein
VKDSSRHIILGTQQFKPTEFGHQINLRFEHKAFLRVCRVADPHRFSADPDPAFHFHADPVPLFNSLRIRIQSFTYNADPDLSPHQSDGTVICDR